MKKLLILIITLLAAGNLTAMDLSLERYMQLVEQNNADLTAADIDRQIAEAQRKLARSQALPMVAGSLGYTRNFLEITTPAAVAASPSLVGGVYPLIYQDVPYNSKNKLTAGIGVQQTVFNMAVFQALKASRVNTDLAGSTYEATRQGILTAAKQLYFQSVLLSEVVKVKQQSENHARDLKEDVQKKADAGIASTLEALQAEVNWKMSQPETTAALRNKAIAMNSLRLLAGISSDEEVTLTDSLTALPPVDAATWHSQIFSDRPDYQALQTASVLQEINRDKVKAEFYPSLNASASYGLSYASDSFSFSNPTDVFSVSFELTIPIFYGGSRFASLEKAELDLKKSLNALEKKQNEIDIELDSIKLLMEEASLRIQSAESTLSLAEKAYAIMEVTLENGMATQLDLKDARLSLEGARLNHLSALYDYLDAYIQWQQATGKGDRNPLT